MRVIIYTELHWGFIFLIINIIILMTKFSASMIIYIVYLFVLEYM